MEILKEEIKLTIEQPDKVMDCDDCRKTFYIRKFRGKGYLLVMAEADKNRKYEVKCFGWIQNVFYPS